VSWYSNPGLLKSSSFVKAEVKDDLTQKRKGAKVSRGILDFAPLRETSKRFTKSDAEESMLFQLSDTEAALRKQRASEL
jgi:hypothetical protein